ncbi:MAG TPA: hypothetical protein VFQ37_11980, partial [Mycobacterium sp.]|nr:hypothetical protein [Mycobacterium sp.]
MPNPPGPDRDDASNPSAQDTETTVPVGDDVNPADQNGPEFDEQVTDSYPIVPAETEAPIEANTEAATEVIATETLTTKPEPEAESSQPKPPERRFTAPGFDAGKTEVLPSVPDAPTDVLRTRQTRLGRLGKAAPQLIPPRLGRKFAVPTSRSWGWVMALILIILTLAVIAVLGTLWLTRDSRPKVSQEDRVRETIHNFDIAVQNGDLATLRTITCGDIRDGYVNYDQRTWDDTYRRVEAAK